MVIESEPILAKKIQYPNDLIIVQNFNSRKRNFMGISNFTVLDKGEIVNSVARGEGNSLL